MAAYKKKKKQKLNRDKLKIMMKENKRIRPLWLDRSSNFYAKLFRKYQFIFFCKFEMWWSDKWCCSFTT